MSLADLGAHRLKDLGRPERIFQLQAAGMRAGFPPLRSLGNPALPNNLPAQLASFVGRYRELAEVRAFVGSSRMVTLTGAGGCGKTRLGLQAAAELLDGAGDGVWLVELAAVSDEDAVAAAICRGAGDRRTSRAGPALEALLDALAPQDVLIVLDNCEHLIGGCAKTADAIVRRCPRVHLLATSREPLGIGGEAIYRVPSLSLPGPGDGRPQRLSRPMRSRCSWRGPGRRASVAGGQADRAAGGVDLSRLDGLPLAIELAAARLRSLSLGRPGRSAGPAFSSAHWRKPRRYGAAADAAGGVEWSYSLLHAAEQSCWAACLCSPRAST